MDTTAPLPVSRHSAARDWHKHEKHWLHGLFGAAVVLPALAFADGMRGGKVAIVLYWEPKLAAVQILGWSLLTALFWYRRAPSACSSPASSPSRGCSL